MNWIVNTPIPISCPDDLGVLDLAPGGGACRRCRRLFSSVNEIPELLPYEALRESSSENIQMNAYRATFSNRPERKWLRPLSVFLHRLGNGYLYTWAVRTLEKLSNGQSLTVLDAGCGDGILRRYLSHRHSYAGIDFSMRPLLRAQHYNPATYFRADLNHLPFPNDTFDTVFSFQALQYLKSPEAALAQLARVLKPSGRLLLTVPNDESFKYRLQGVPKIQLQRFDRHSLPALLRHHFKDVSARTRGIWIPIPKISAHAPGVYPLRWGLSWTIIATPDK